MRAVRTPATWLRSSLATLRLAALSVLGLAGAVLALLPLVLAGGPVGRRVERLPSRGSRGIAAGDEGSEVDEAESGRRAGHSGRR